MCIVDSKNMCFGQELMNCCWVYVSFTRVCVIASFFGLKGVCFFGLHECDL